MEDQDQKQKINLNFKLLTGGNFTISVHSTEITVDFLKKIVSKKLKISKDRICLMNSERELQDGTLKQNGIVNGSKIIVTPNVETGLAQRTENTVMQALESLNDNQVNDFLSGKSPLNLSVRLGDHMMLIQLQLSTLSPSQQNSLKQKVANAAALKQQQASKNAIINCSKSSTQASTSQKRSFDDIDESAPEKQRMKTDVDQHEDDSKSPIKSLSSMVSSPLTTTVQNMNQNNNKFWAPTVDPIAANLTSCLCKRLNISCNNNCGQRPEPADDEPCCSYSNNIAPPRPIPFHQRPSTSIMIKPKQQPTISETVAVAEVNPEQPLLNTDNPALAEASRNLTQTLRKLSKRVFTSKTHLMENSQQPSTSSASAPPTSGSSNRTSSSFSSSSSSSNNSQAASVAGSSGAVIESMKHHGKGIYSGTFSGTLNPALQDKNGRPKRDISTIIHILNDLLSATPQCARNGAKIFFEPTQTSSGSTGKFIKVKKQSSSRNSCTRCVPTVLSSSQQKCAYGQCNGHSKTELTASASHLIPSTSAGQIARSDCAGCNQNLINRKLEIENMKTKNKLDHLKLVMQQKKERREARKLKIAPYMSSQHVTLGNQLLSTIPYPLVSTNESLNESLVESSLTLNTSNDSNSSSSATATAAIATSISTNNTEIENHLEEVDTVA